MVPALKSAHITTGAKPKTEPTERSNSPDVIRSVMASAIRPSSTVKVSALPMLVSDRNAGIDRREDDQHQHEKHQRPELGHRHEEADEARGLGRRNRRSGAVVVAHAGPLRPGLKQPPATRRGRRGRSRQLPPMIP